MKQADTKRTDPRQRRFYGSTAWKVLRTRVRTEQPTCAVCGERPTAVVDHADGDWTNNARSNLRGLCRRCNASHTGRQHAGKRGQPRDEPPAPDIVFA